MSDGKSMTVQDLKAFLDEFNRHDADTIAESFTEDGAFETVRENKRITGKAELREYFAKMFEKTQDVHFGGDAHFVDGDRGLSEWRMTGTEASGERLDMRGCDVFTFRDGKILKKDSYLKQT